MAMTSKPLFTFNRTLYQLKFHLKKLISKTGSFLLKKTNTDVGCDERKYRPHKPNAQFYISFTSYL